MLLRDLLDRALTPVLVLAAVTLAAALFGLVHIPVLSPTLDKAAVTLGLKENLKHLPPASPEALEALAEEANTVSNEDSDFPAYDQALEANDLREAYSPTTSADESKWEESPAEDGVSSLPGVPVDAATIKAEANRTPAGGASEPTKPADGATDSHTGGVGSGSVPDKTGKKADPSDPSDSNGAEDEKDEAAEPAPEVEKPKPEPPPPPPAPLLISDVHVQSVTPSSVSVSWRTNLKTRSRLLVGSQEPVLWSAASEGQAHQVSFDGLSYQTGYEFRVVAWDDYGRRVESGPGRFQTPFPSGDARSSTRGDDVLVNGHQFFPLFVWDRCGEWGKLIGDGINLFMGTCPATPFETMANAVRGRAFSLTAHNHPSGLSSVIGRYLPDEWDEHLPGDVTDASLDAQIPPKPPGQPDWLTLTNHFYSGADPLPQGRGMYGKLIERADVVGFDLYPLQIWCRDSWREFADVYLAQRELHQMSGGKPTFQWIEVDVMSPCGKGMPPTAETVRAQTWLAVAGGADGIGYFPHWYKEDVAPEVRRSNRQILALQPALLASEHPSSSHEIRVKVGARNLNGALYVIAVNTDRRNAVDASINVAGLQGRRLTVYGESRTVSSDGDTFQDHFTPLAVHIYVVEPR